MRVFVGYGYNTRDRWIEEHVFRVLEYMGFSVIHGKDMHGDILQPVVLSRIDQSDAAIGFFTIREGQGEADFNSHIWVRDEMLHAAAMKKAVISVREEGVKVPNGLLGERQWILLRQDDRLACVAELVAALGRRSMRRLKLEPDDEQMSRNLHQLSRNAAFLIQYRTRDANGLESSYRQGRMELVNQGFYVNVYDVPKQAYVEVEGMLNGASLFSSGWVSADAIQVKIL